MITEIVLMDVRFKAMLAQKNPAGLKEKIREQKSDADTAPIASLRATVTAADKRLSELEKLVQSVYEDKVKGTIPKAVCVQLMRRYEDERLEKLSQRTELTAKLEALEKADSGADEWTRMIRDYTKLETLDRPTLLRFINRIEAGERKTVDGRDERDIKIYYNFVGFIEI